MAAHLGYHHRQLRRWRIPEQDWDDVIQETAYQAMRNLYLYRGEGPLGGFIDSIFRRQLGGYVKRVQRRRAKETDKSLDDGEVVLPDRRQSVETMLLVAERSTEVRQAVGMLRGKQRQAMDLLLGGIELDTTGVWRNPRMHAINALRGLLAGRRRPCATSPSRGKIRTEGR